MPQVLAKRPRRFAAFLLLSFTVLVPPLPAQAEEPREGTRPRLSCLVAGLGDSWFRIPFLAAWLADTVPVDPEGETPVDQGGASMDPAGQGQPPGSTGTGASSSG